MLWHTPVRNLPREFIALQCSLYHALICWQYCISQRNLSVLPLDPAVWQFMDGCCTLRLQIVYFCCQAALVLYVATIVRQMLLHQHILQALSTKGIWH